MFNHRSNISFTDNKDIIAYLGYIFFHPPLKTDPDLKQGQETIVQSQNLGQIISNELGKKAYKDKLALLAQNNIAIIQAQDAYFHIRVKRLQEVLERCLSASEKQAFIQNLGESANHLRIAILQAQIMDYAQRQQGAIGMLNAIGSIVGVNGYSQEKGKFLRQIITDFSKKHLAPSNTTTTNTLPSRDDAKWQTLLRKIILPGVDTMKALSWLPEDYLEEIGIGYAIRSLDSSYCQELGLTVELSFEDQQLIRIKHKTDGKNSGSYDGIYVLKTAYDALPIEDRHKLNAYKKGEVFFLKMFPTGKKMVEGFAEGFVGNFIKKLIGNNFIDACYQDCFAPASIVELPHHAGPALLQSFVLGAKLLYQCANANLEAKPALSEATNKFWGNGYERYLNQLPQQAHVGLSFIVMLMLMVANYSVHSGNILVSEVDGTNQFTAIDYGAALRYFMGTFEQTNLWIPLEEQLGLLISSGVGTLRQDKRYLEHYASIPGFLESSIDHAKTLLKKINASSEIFKECLYTAIRETYYRYEEVIVHQYGQPAWENAKIELFNYIYGPKHFSEFQTEREKHNHNEMELLCKNIYDVMLLRVTTTAVSQAPKISKSNATVDRYASVRMPRSSSPAFFDDDSIATPKDDAPTNTI